MVVKAWMRFSKILNETSKKMNVARGKKKGARVELWYTSSSNVGEKGTRKVNEKESPLRLEEEQV